VGGLGMQPTSTSAIGSIDGQVPLGFVVDQTSPQEAVHLFVKSASFISMKSTRKKINIMASAAVKRFYLIHPLAISGEADSRFCISFFFICQFFFKPRKLPRGKRRATSTKIIQKLDHQLN
jgi:hypothetical protein